MPEGYVEPNSSNGFNYVYQFKDHLDNVRLSYTKNDTGNLEIFEENNYYPFGLKHKGYNNTVSPYGNSTAQLRGFGSKEEQNELGLDWIDITARNYDPAIGRWMNLDPLAEQMRRHSPYNYAFDNPISFIDPDGMAPEWINNGDGTYTAEAGDSASTLADDAGITFDEANELVQDQLGENYIDPTDGIEQSDVEVGDSVTIPEEKESIEQKNELNEWNNEVVKEIETEVSNNEASIDKNNKDVDSISSEKDKLETQIRLSEEINENMPDFPDEPRGGLGLGVALKNGLKELKIRKMNKNIKKIKNKTDSLKKVNKTLNKEKKRRGSVTY